MAGEIKEDFIQSEFKYCVVNWEIENYEYAAHGRKYELESVCFEVEPFTTLWKFGLISDRGLCDDSEILFSLKRVDSEYETVWVSYDVSLIDQTKKQWRGAREEGYFKPSDKHCLSIPNIYYEKVNASVYNFRSMTIHCQMLVLYDEKFNYCRLWIAPGLKGLAKDMDKLYKNKKFTDVTIKLEDNAEVEAHKAILSARNKYMRDNLRATDTPVLNCSSLHSDGMEQVLRYFYTGNIVKSIFKPSISVHDCISYLSIEELKIHFKASEIKLNSSVEVYPTGLVWRIENFSDRNEKCIVSDLIYSDLDEMVWKLSLYPKGRNGDEEHLAVIAENVKGKINGNVWAKVEIYSDPFCRTWKTMKEIKQGEIFEISNLENVKSALEKLEEGSLRIGFKACASVRETHSFVNQKTHTIQRTSLEDYYKNLSKDILELRKDDKYADVTIVTGNANFKAHKCILSVRSPKFAKQLSNQNEDNTINIEDVRPEIVEIVLDYMYSGVIGMYDWPIIIEVYEAAVKIKANYLQQECSIYLGKNINMDNLLKIWTAAYDGKDFELEQAAANFSRVHVLKR